MAVNIDIKSLSVYDFGNSQELSDELLTLILRGQKTATCATVVEFEKEGEAIPEAGELKLVVDYHSKPICIIEITEVSIMPFCEVDEKFAYDEGEGDRTLKCWKVGHTAYFKRVLPVYGVEFSESIPLICQRFKVTEKI